MRTAKSAVSQRWTEVEERRVVEEWRLSGLSVSEFCGARGLDAQRLYRWRSVIRERSTEPVAAHPVFLPVTLRQAKGPDGVGQGVALSGRVSVQYGDARVEVWDGLSSSMLNALLHQLKAAHACG